jgi:predicted RND superfamily exporter protein
MPVFEPSVDTTSNQQLTAILVPVLVMLGGIGISYGIYTALRWFSLSRRRQPCDPARTDTEAVVCIIIPTLIVAELVAGD